MWTPRRARPAIDSLLSHFVRSLTPLSFAKSRNFQGLAGVRSFECITV